MKLVQLFSSGWVAGFARPGVIPSTLRPKPSITMTGRRQRLASMVALAAGSALIAWTALGHWQVPSFGPRQPDYYNLLVDGFRKGSLALDIEVPERIKEAKNPIDLLVQAPGVAPHDLSYYKGHFYTYYGVVPAVVLYWPFKALTGRGLPLVVGSMAFAIGAFLTMAFLWLKIVRTHFPRAGLASRVGGIAALGLAGGQLVLARRLSIWEPSIEAGNFFLACALATAYLSLWGRKPWGWLAACGLSIGLAAGSRPTLVVAGFALIPLVAAVGLRATAEGRSPIGPVWRALLAAGIPLGAIGIGLLAYNWGRFGNPLEFGLNYQLSTWNLVKKAHFRTAFIPFNAFLYFLASPQWGRYFPFVHPIAYPRLPDGYYGYEYVYGALVICPVLWWGACVPPLIRRADPVLRHLAAFTLTVAAATTLVLLCFDTSAARYETDFLPWWIFISLLGWLLLEERVDSGGHEAATRLLRISFLATAAFSCLLAFCCSAEIHEVFEASNPAAYRNLSRVFNAPTGMWERLVGQPGGAIEMNLTFARKPTGSVEPLVVTGVEYQRDYAYLYYQRDDVVRFCYVHPGEPVASSADVPIEPGRRYPIRIECGALYPPEGHPAYNGWQPQEITSLKHWVRIDFDGRTVLSESRGWNEASPGTVQVGVDAGGGYCGRRFAGTISDVRRTGWARSVGDLASNGDFDFSVELPSRPSALNSPVLTVGSPGGADIVGMNVTGSGQYRFIYESWGFGLWQSDPLRSPADRLVSFRVRLGPTLKLDEGSPLGIIGRSVVIWEEGRPVWWHRTYAPIAAKAPFALFTNSLASTSLEPAFKGRLVSASRSPLATTWRKGPFSALELQLGGRGDGCEPLVATGAAGHSDTLSIDWLGKNRARLVYDHWGQAIQSSRPFEWQDSDLKSVRVEMPSFASLDGSGTPGGAGRLRASVDGSMVWDTKVPSFAAASETVAIGKNASGCSSAGAELRAVVIDVRQVN
jgi:hypothetical protein